MSNYSQLYESWTSDERKSFGRYCRFLRDTKVFKKSVSKNEWIVADVGIEIWTLRRVLNGETIEKQIDKLDPLVEYLIKNIRLAIDGGKLEDTHIPTFEDWLEREVQDQEGDETQDQTSDDATKYEDAINENPSSTWAKRPGRWLGYVIGIVIVSALAQQAVSAFSFWLSEKRYLAEATKQQEKNKAAQAAARIPPTISWEEVTPKYQVRYFNGIVSFDLIELVGTPPDSQIVVSNNAIDFDFYKRTAYPQKNFLPSDQFVVRLMSYGWDGATNPYDLTKLARTSIEQELTNSTGYNPSSGIICKPGSCTIIGRRYCKGDWSRLTIGRQPEAVDAFADFGECAKIKSSGSICLDAPTSFFPTRPGDTLYVSVYDQKGNKFQFKVKVRDWEQVSDFETAYTTELKRVSDSETTPYALARFTPSLGRQPRGHFDVRVSAGTCGSGLFADDPIVEQFYDVDGRGFLNFADRDDGIPLSKTNQLKIKMLSRSGKSYGPYIYEFNTTDIIADRVKLEEKPTEIQCKNVTKSQFGLHTLGYWCRADVKGDKIMAWSKVDKVMFGLSKDALNQTFDVDIGLTEILAVYENGNFTRSPDLNVAKVEPSWTDFFYRIHYNDKTKGPIRRITLPKVN